MFMTVFCLDDKKQWKIRKLKYSIERIEKKRKDKESRSSLWAWAC